MNDTYLNDTSLLTKIAFNFVQNTLLDLGSYVDGAKTQINSDLILRELICLRDYVNIHLERTAPPPGLTNGEYFTIYEQRARAHRILENLEYVEKCVNEKKNQKHT